MCADVPLSVGILDPRASPTQLNTVEFLWDPSKRASAFIQVRGGWGGEVLGRLPAGGYAVEGLPTGGYTGGRCRCRDGVHARFLKPALQALLGLALCWGPGAVGE